ncbi:MAG: phosphatidylserine/phosphatidylglycerophosphate/cardiolipin synthase family protein [Candidatus Heimdallarchaeota archaeon]
MIFEETTKEVVHDYSEDIIENVWSLRSRIGSSTQVKESEGDGVWSTGDRGVFRSVLVSAIGRAHEVVCISSFLMGEEEIERALLSAVARGVRVYILSVPDVILDREEAIMGEEERVDERAEEYKAFLNHIAGKMLLRAASHFHSKFLLVDLKDSSHMEGYLSTANFNKALVEGVELGVRLTPSEIHGVFQQFVRGFWVEASQELRHKGRLSPVSSHPKDLAIPTKVDGVLTTIASRNSDIKTLQEGIVEFLEQTEGPVYLSMFGFEEGHAVLSAITNHAKEREITVLTRLRPSFRQIRALNELVDAGVTILGHERLHAKAIVSKMQGEPVALVMTANLQSRGMDEGYETGVLLRGRRAQRVEEILNQWTEEFPWIFQGEAKLGELLGPIWLSIENNFTKTAVEEEKTIDGGVILIKSLDIDPVKMIPERRTRSKDEFYHRVKVTYHLKPPLVPAMTKRINDDVSPLPLYKTDKNTFIAVKNEKELQSAIWLKDQRYPNALIVVEGK